MTDDNKNDTSPPSVVNALSILDAYFTCHSNGNQSIKSAVLNITKARRLQGGCIDCDEMSAYYSACHVREELLRARAMVACKPLVDDEDDRYFLSFDGNLKISDNDSPELVDEDSCVVEDDVPGLEQQDGLRRRKKGLNNNSEPQKPSEWTAVQEQHHNECTEEEKLRNMDPITLFGGFAPPALKEAQKNAKQALSSYVEAANLAAYLLSLLSAEKKE
jgi:hypothetical protein